MTAGSGSSARPYARSWKEAAPLLDARRPLDAVVLDVRFDLPDEELLPDERPLGDDAAGRRRRRERRDRQGVYILERLRRRRPDLPVLLTTAYDEIPFEEAALALRADAFTYAVGEDEASAEAIVRSLRRILAERDSPPRTGRFFWGSSAAMRELRRRVSALAPTPMPLLVTGPTGTGKSLLVRDVIHTLSGRSGPVRAVRLRDRSRRDSSRRRSSERCAAPSPARSPTAPGSSRPRRRGRSFSTRSRTSPPTRRRCC